MALSRITVETRGNAAQLINQLHAEVDKNDKGQPGSIRTWVHYPTDTKWLSHTGEGGHFKGKGFISEGTASGTTAVFDFAPPQGGEEHGIRGIYLGRFSELIINHWGDAVTRIIIT
jgi:hypothetical protein